jgi:hypothetical protein
VCIKSSTWFSLLQRSQKAREPGSTEGRGGE